jgi:hypothetical protein
MYTPTCRQLTKTTRHWRGQKWSKMADVAKCRADIFRHVTNMSSDTSMLRRNWRCRHPTNPAKACVEGILRLFTNFYLQRKLSIFLRNNHDCKVVDPYNRLPQDWPHRGIQRINWPANQSRFVTKWLKRGCVHNLDSLKKELSNKNPAKKHKHTKTRILASTQCLDFTRNTTWQANCFSLIKKPK